MIAAAVAIRVERCAKTFDDGTRALTAVDLEIAAGEIVVLLGPSGCGKTTLLRLIAGLEAPDAGGRILFDADDVTPLPIEKRNVGMVFQSYALFPNMDVRANIEYGLKVRRMPAPERRARVDEMLAMMRIEALAARHIDQLSGGQRQRVALARALAVRPRLLLLDEPLTALDAKLRDVLRFEIDALLRRLAITAVFVTHDQAEAMALGDRVAVMGEGRIQQIAAPAEIYRRPANRFVAEFVGTMNRITGRLTAAGFETAAGTLPWPGASPGTVEAMFRPESVAIVAPGAGQLTGTVTALFFLGDRTRVHVEAAGAALVIDSAQALDIARGATVGLAVAPGALMAGDRTS
jgi:putative spermidine/putrescine transport system ATP-binding protein